MLDWAMLGFMEPAGPSLAAAAAGTCGEVGGELGDLLSDVLGLADRFSGCAPSLSCKNQNSTVSPAVTTVGNLEVGGFPSVRPAPTTPRLTETTRISGCDCKTQHVPIKKRDSMHSDVRRAPAGQVIWCMPLPIQTARRKAHAQNLQHFSAKTTDTHMQTKQPPSSYHSKKLSRFKLAAETGRFMPMHMHVRTPHAGSR